VLEGTILSQGERYWVKSPDGTSKIVPDTEVKKYVKGAAAAAVSGTPVVPGAAVAPAASASADLASTKRKADAVETPLAAVTLWQKFIEAKPSPADLATAKAETDKWQKMADEGAEKVNGKWVTGDALKELHGKVRDKLRQAAEDMHSEKTLQALKTLEEVRKMYPNSFEANFFTGYLTLLEHKDKDAI